jgi:hypothetical protein
MQSVVLSVEADGLDDSDLKSVIGPRPPVLTVDVNTVKCRPHHYKSQISRGELTWDPVPGVFSLKSPLFDCSVTARLPGGPKSKVPGVIEGSWFVHPSQIPKEPVKRTGQNDSLTWVHRAVDPVCARNARNVSGHKADQNRLDSCHQND